MTSKELVLNGKYYRDEGRFDEAYRFFLEAALKNDPVAIKNLGMVHMYGSGVRQNFEKGFHYLRAAYDLMGDVSVIHHAMVVHSDIVNDECGRRLYKDFMDYLIGKQEWTIYIVKANEYSEQGVYPNDVEKRIECYEKAVSKGINVGNDCLGELYFLGKDVKRDYRKAYGYFNSYQGFESFAKPYYLGRMYEDGLYVKRNPESAYRKYRQIVDSSIPMRGSDVFYIKASKKIREIESGLRGVI